MEQKTSTIDTRLDQEYRSKVSRWLGEKAVANSFTLAHTPEQYQENPDAFEIRTYQLEAWANLWGARQAGTQRGFVHLATGLGKTSVAVFDVMKFREEQMAQDPPTIPRVLFVSHQNDISNQAKERFEYFMPDVSTTTFETRRENLPDADITFATFQSLYSELDRFDPQDFEYIIYDEAHHSEANTFKEVRDFFDPLYELGLTATPDRMDDKDIREYFGEPLYSKSLAEGIAEGWLADVDYHIVFDDIVKQLMKDGFEPKTLREFHELFKVRPRNETIAKNIREERHKIGLDAAKTIIFCEDISHAEEMAELLDGVAYHSDIKKNDRKRILTNFRNNTNQVICTVDAFNEGIDIPDARLVVFLRSTQSGTIFEQQLGRGLRRTRDKGRVSVLDFVANIERIQKVRELSKEIRKLTEEDGENADIDTATTGKEDGLRIHGPHSDFDFDRIAVDLLRIFDQLQPNLQPPPEGYVSVNRTAEILEMSPKTVAGLCESQGWELPYFRMAGGSGRGISPDQLEILQQQKIADAENGMFHLTAAARQMRVMQSTLRECIVEIGWKLPDRKFRNGNTTKVITLAQMAILQERFPDVFAPAPPPGYISVNMASRRLCVDYDTLVDLIDTHGWKLPTYRFGTRAAKALSQEQLTALARYRGPEIPDADETIVNITSLAHSLKCVNSTIRRIILEHNLTVTQYRFGQKRVLGDGLTREQVAIIKKALSHDQNEGDNTSK
jgi:superfamily II DNA or RNA helicase